MMGLALCASGLNRVLRGGSWNNFGRNCRSADRNGNTPDNRNRNTGFRLARAQEDAGWHFLTQPKACPRIQWIWRQMIPLCRYVSSHVDAGAKACRHFQIGRDRTTFLKIEVEG